VAELELTVKQAARDLRTTPRTIRRWIHSGKLTGRKVDRRTKTGTFGQQWLITADSVRRMTADIAPDTTRRTPQSDTPPDTVAADLLAEVRSLRQENAEYRQHLERLTVAVEDLRRALPPAPKESWWSRMWQRILDNRA